MTEKIKGIGMPADLPQDRIMRAGFKAGVLAALEVAVPLLEAYVDDEPCELDHHGYCQSHGLSEAPCINERTKAFLAAAGPEMVWEKRVGSAGGLALHWCFEHQPQGVLTHLVPLAPLGSTDCVQCGRRLRHG